jgi:hypothetical protein
LGVPLKLDDFVTGSAEQLRNLPGADGTHGDVAQKLSIGLESQWPPPRLVVRQGIKSASVLFSAWASFSTVSIVTLRAPRSTLLM